MRTLLWGGGVRERLGASSCVGGERLGDRGRRGACGQGRGACLELRGCAEEAESGGGGRGVHSKTPSRSWTPYLAPSAVRMIDREFIDYKTSSIGV